MKKNPTKKPKAPRGYRAAWVKPYRYYRVVGRRKKIHGWEKIRKGIRVPGHWSTVKTSKPPVVRKSEKRRVKKITLPEWERAFSYEERYRREYDLAGADPIYRFNRQRDVVKVGGTWAGLVWDKPIKADVRGNYDTGRVWYIAHHDTQEENYLYVRTFQLEYGMSSLSVAEEDKEKWEAAILGEYEGKEYMAVERFVGWTVFDSRQRLGKNLHQGASFRRKDTKERAFSTKWKYGLKKPKVLKTRSGEARTVTRMSKRELTPWEVKKAIKALGGGKMIGLTMRKGESVRDAFKRYSPSEKRFYRKKLSRAVEVLEERWRKERRGA
jgi:hypothetical protein